MVQNVSFVSPPLPCAVCSVSPSQWCKNSNLLPLRSSLACCVVFVVAWCNFFSILPPIVLCCCSSPLWRCNSFSVLSLPLPPTLLFSVVSAIHTKLQFALITAPCRFLAVQISLSLLLCRWCCSIIALSTVVVLSLLEGAISLTCCPFSVGVLFLLQLPCVFLFRGSPSGAILPLRCSIPFCCRSALL